MKARALQARIAPLKWVPHHIKNNGFHGHTVTDNHVCYVYQPWDNRIKRGPMPWAIHSYLGAVEKPVRKGKDERRFRSARLAKAAAQRWWQREVRGLFN